MCSSNSTFIIVYMLHISFWFKLSSCFEKLRAISFIFSQRFLEEKTSPTIMDLVFKTPFPGVASLCVLLLRYFRETTFFRSQLDLLQKVSKSFGIKHLWKSLSILHQFLYESAINTECYVLYPIIRKISMFEMWKRSIYLFRFLTGTPKFHIERKLLDLQNFLKKLMFQ